MAGARRVAERVAATGAHRPGTRARTAAGRSPRAGLRAIPLIILGFLVATPSSFAQTQADPEAPTGFAPKPLASSERHMIVAAHPMATQAGLSVLRAGGSAVDAAIAAQLVLGVVEPQSSGIGGGGFTLRYDAATGEVAAWDGRETAPAGATADMFLDDNGAPLPFLEAVAGGASVGAPGLLNMLAALHERHGKLPWARLFDDAIWLARAGFPVSPRLAALLQAFGARLRDDPSAGSVFLDETGAPHVEGVMLHNGELARTLERVAEFGAEELASGRTAEAIVGVAGRPPRPSTLTLEDLAAQTSVERAPLCVFYRERWEVCGMPPPSSGGLAVGQMLGLLEYFPIDAMPPGAPLARHLILEASRLAFADRAAFAADPDHVSVPVAGLLDPLYLTVRAQEISAGRASKNPAEAGNPPWREGRVDGDGFGGAWPWGPDPALGRPGTTHLSVVDAEGNAVALTSSIETAFGSGRMAAGLLLNNQLTDFAFDPVSADGRPAANAVAPGKRPRSSMAPTLVFDHADGTRRLVYVLGSPGGSRIIEYVAEALVALLDWEMDPAAAAALPHASHRNGKSVRVEDDPKADALANALKGLGHLVERAPMTSGLHIIRITPEGVLEGGADPRREGLALGD